MKNHLILEFTEFNAMRMGQDSTPMALHVDNPQKSHGAFDKHLHNVRDMNIRLNTILKQLMGTNNIWSKGGGIIKGLDSIENIKIQRQFIKNGIDLDIYLTFELEEKEYFASIKNFITQPKIDSELFSDPDYALTKEWVIKIKGLLKKVIEKWMTIPSNTKWKALKDISCVDYNTGQLIEIKEGSLIKVVRTLNDKIIIEINDTKCILDKMNYYFFNYWFEKQ